MAYRAAHASGVRFSEIHLNDIDGEKAAALDARIRSAGGAAVVHNGPAAVVIDSVIDAINPAGLHFAFLDPYNLEYLSFDIIEKLSRFRHMDMLVHVSVQDLQRNLDRYSVQGGVFDKFAPGWRTNVNPNQAIAPFRAALLDYWLGEIRKLGTMPAEGMELIVGSKNQRLYWLMFVAAHDWLRSSGAPSEILAVNRTWNFKRWPTLRSNGPTRPGIRFGAAPRSAPAASIATPRHSPSGFAA